MEPRLLLSADALAPLALSLSDDADDVTLLLDQTSDLLRVIDNNTSAVVAEQLLAETSEVVIDAGRGNDRLKLDTSLPDSLTVRFDGGEGIDTLVGPDLDTAWRVTGLDSGLIDGTRFTNVENLEGAADNEDTFVFGAYGELSGVVEGGDGGFDTVEFTGWRFDEVTAIATGADSGVVDRDGNQVFYSGMEPVDLGTVASDFRFEVSATPFSTDPSPPPGTTESADEIILRNVPGVPGQMEIVSGSASPTFESVTFMVPLSTPTSPASITIDAGGGNDIITIESLDPAFVGELIVIGGAGDDTLNGLATYATTYRFADGWGNDTIIDQGGGDRLDFSAFTGVLALRAPGDPAGPEVTGSVGGTLSGTVDTDGPFFLADLEILEALGDEAELTGGLEDLVSLAGELGSSGLLATPLFLLADRSIGETLNLDEILRSHVLDPLSALLGDASNPATTLDELVLTLHDSDASDGVTIGAIAALDAGALMIDLHVSAARTLNGVALDLAGGIEEFLLVDSMTGDLTTTWDWDFRIGVDASGDFFADFANDIDVTADLAVPDLALSEVRAGFLGLEVLASSSIVLDLDLSVGTSASPLGLGVTRADLMQPSSLAAALTQSASTERLDILLDVQAQAGVTGVTPGSLLYSDGNLFEDDGPEAFTRAGFEAGSGIADFYQSDSGSVQSLFDQFAAFLGSFDTVALNLPISLTQDQTLGDVFDLEASFRQAVGDHLDQQALTEATLLSGLNGGRGLRTVVGDDLEIELVDGSRFRVDLSSATTLGDVIAAIETASGKPDTKFEVGIDSDIDIETGIDRGSGGLRLVDKTTGDGEFRVAPANLSPALSDLGLRNAGAGTPDAAEPTHRVIFAEIGFPGPNFDTMQQLLARLAGSIGPSASYDATDHGLSFDLSVDLAGPVVEGVSLALFDLGPLTDLASTGLLDLSPTGTLSLPVKMLLTDIGFAVDESTLLDTLNAGRGVTRAGEPADALADIEVRLADGTSFEVDLSAATTLGEVIAAIESAAAATAGITTSVENASAWNFRIGIGADGLGLVVVDGTTPIAPIIGMVSDVVVIDADPNAPPDDPDPGDDATLTDTTRDFTSFGDLTGYTVQITSGAGERQERTIIAVTEHTLTVDFDWDTGLDLTSEYLVFRPFDVQALNESPARVGLGLFGSGSADALNADTLLDEVNDGLGVRVTAPGTNDIRVETRDGTAFDVDLGGATTLADVMQAIRDAAELAGLTTSATAPEGTEPDFEARVEPGSGNLSLVDRTTDTGALQVTALAGSLAGVDLGLIGTAAVLRDVDGSEAAVIDLVSRVQILSGNVLHGDTTSAHIGLRTDASPTLTLDVAIADQPGGIGFSEGLWGALAVSATGGDLAAGATTGQVLQFADPGTDPGTSGLATFRELKGGLGNFAGLDQDATDNPEGILAFRAVSGHFSLDLPLLPNAGISGASDSAPVLHVELSDITDASTLALSFTNGSPNNTQQLLEAVHDLSVEEVITALAGAADYLSQLESSALLGGADNLLTFALPGLSQSLGQILPFGQAFASRMDELAASPPAILQDVAAALDALVDASSVVSGASLTFDPSTSQLTLELDFALLPSVTDLPLTLDLTALGVDLAVLKLDTIGVINDWTVSDPVAVHAGGSIHLGIAIDLAKTTPGDPDPLSARNETSSLVGGAGPGGTSLSFGLEVEEADLNFETALGSLGVDVVGGRFVLDADGGPVGTLGDPASYLGALPAGLHAIGSASEVAAAANATTLGLSGALRIELPMDFPEEVQPPNQPPLILTISDLGAAAVGAGASSSSATPLAGQSSASSALSTTLAGPPVRDLQGLVSLKDNLRGFAGGFYQLLTELDVELDSEVFSHALPLVGDQLSEAIDFFLQIRDKVTDNLDLLRGRVRPEDVQKAFFDAFGPGGFDWLVDKNGSQLPTASDVFITMASDAEVRFELDLLVPQQALVAPVNLDLNLPGLGLWIDALVEVLFGLDGDPSTPELDPVTFAFGIGAAGVYMAPLDVKIAIDARPRSAVAMTDDPRLTFRQVGATPEIERDAGDWILDGFEVGQIVTVAHSSSNDGEYEIAAIDASGRILTLSTAPATAGALAGVNPEEAAGIRLEVKDVVALRGNPNLTFADDSALFTAGADTITRSAGSWIDDGFEVGHTITIAGAGSNDGQYEIAAIDETGRILTLATVPDGSGVESGVVAAGAANGISVEVEHARGFAAKLGFLPMRAFDLVDVHDAATAPDPTELHGFYSISLADDASGDGRIFRSGLASGVSGSFDGEADINLRLETDLPAGTALPPYRMDLKLADWDVSIGPPTPPPDIVFDDVQFELVGFMRDFMGAAVGRLNTAAEPFRGLVDFLTGEAFPILSVIFGRSAYAGAAGSFGGTAEIGDFAGAITAIRHLVEGGQVASHAFDGNSTNELSTIRPVSLESLGSDSSVFLPVLPFLFQGLTLNEIFPLLTAAESQALEEALALFRAAPIASLTGEAWIDIGSFTIDGAQAAAVSATPLTPKTSAPRAFGAPEDDALDDTILGDIREIAMQPFHQAQDAALGLLTTQLLPGRSEPEGFFLGGPLIFAVRGGIDPIEVPLLNDATDRAAGNSFSLLLGHTAIGAASEEESRLLRYGTPELFVALHQDIPLGKETLFETVFGSETLSDILTGTGFSVTVHLAIGFEARADLQMEYDTTGLATFAKTGNAHDIVDGLFFDDTKGIEENPALLFDVTSRLPSQDQSRILGNLGLGVTLAFQFGPFSIGAGAEALFFIGETRSFNDPNNDGKLRAHEFDLLLEADPALLRSAPDNLYDIGIGTEVRFDVFAFIDFGAGFFSFTLLEFRVNLITIVFPTIKLPGATAIFPELATTSDSATGTTLELSIGGSDNHTLYIGAGATDDEIIVSGPTHFEVFTGITRITGSGGSGNDTIIISPDVVVPVDISGGGGADRLIAGGGVTRFDGGPGADIIWGGERDDTLLGGDQDDIILGGDGADRIEGGGHADLIFGGRGGDWIFGGPGADRIDGGTGDDEIEGGAGDDVILGRLGNDKIWGDRRPGVVVVSAANRIEGGDGRDWLIGGNGPDLLYGGLGNDTLEGRDGVDQLFGGRQNDTLDGGAGADALFGQGASNRLIGGAGPDSLVSERADDFLDGRDGSDTYSISFAGGETTSQIRVLDSGDLTGTDRLVVNGTVFDDQFLLRADSSGLQAFVALINSDSDVERVDYSGIERIVVNGDIGADHFAVDDTAAEATLNGGIGADTFQIGQLFKSRRTEPDAGVSLEDEFLTIETTRGFLSNGISAPMTVNGGLGADSFVVFHNKAVLSLSGDEGDDVFEVRAFALVGSQEPQRARTDVSGGAGADLVQYAVNAPVNVDGGDGLDTLVVFGTEFGDDIVITDDGVFGAGLTVNFVNIETLRVDGAEGDDRFFVQSTSENFVTELFGGLGSDTFNMSGGAPPVVSNDLLGHSGIILHDIESGSDAAFDGQQLFGISTNVADNEEPFVVIRQSGGSTILNEGDTVGDSYEVVLTQLPTTFVFVKALAPLPTPTQRDKQELAFRVSSPNPDAVTEADGSAVTLVFTPENWFLPQVVEVHADGVTQTDSAQTPLFTRPELVGEDETFAYDDSAFEGVRFGVINHLVLAGSESVESVAQQLSANPTLTIAIPAGADPADFSPPRLVGRMLEIVSGPGAEQERLIIGATVSAGQVELSLDRAWLVTDIPTAQSEFRLELTSGPLQDSPLAVSNPTLTIEPDGLAPDDFLGRKVEIIDGGGAGQSRFIIDASANTDGSVTLTLDRGWLTTDVPSANRSFEQFAAGTDISGGIPLSLEFDVGSVEGSRGGTLRVQVLADLDEASEFLSFEAEGIDLGDLFDTNGERGRIGEIALTQAQLRTLARDGKIVFTVTPSPSVTSLGFGGLALELEIVGSEFLVRVDDALVGTMTDDPQSLPPTPDGVERATFTDTSASFPTDGQGLTGAILKIVGGPGAGQQRLILGHVEGDEANTLILNGPWRGEQPVAHETLYRIERYDGLAIPSLQVQVNDNDEAGVIVDETRGVRGPGHVPDTDTITAVIEGGDGDQLGEQDVLQVQLSSAPQGTVEVHLSIRQDGQAELGDVQLHLTNDADGTALTSPTDGSSIASLVFDASNWDQPRTVRIQADDDSLREGFHTGLIEFEMTASNAADRDGLVLDEDIFDISEENASEVLGLSHQPDGALLSVRLEMQAPLTAGTRGTPGAPDTIRYQLLPDSNKVLFLDDQGEPVTVHGDIRVEYAFEKPGFDGASTAPVLVRIADDDAPTVLVRETGGSTDVLEFDAAAVPQDLETSWGRSQTQHVDAIGPHELTFEFDVGSWSPSQDGLLVAPTEFGRLLRFEAEGVLLNSIAGPEIPIFILPQAQLEALAADGTISITVTSVGPVNELAGRDVTLDLSFTATPKHGDSYELVLTAAPTDPVTVLLTPDATKTTRTGGIRHDLVQVAISSSDLRVRQQLVGGVPTGNLLVEFTAANWDQPVSIDVEAIDDAVVDGGDTKVFAPEPNTLSGILGPVFVEGAGGSGSLSIGTPVLLPGETNLRTTEGNVTGFDASQEGGLGALETMTVERTDLEAEVARDPQLDSILDLVGRTIEMSRGPGTGVVLDPSRPDDLFDRVWLIQDVQTIAGDDAHRLLILQNPTRIDPSELAAEDVPTSASEYAITNLSANFFVDEATQVDSMFVHDEDSPADSRGVLTASRLSGLNMGPDLAFDGRLRPGGISYGDLEVLEINLGTGNNRFEVLGTHTRDDGFQTWTFLNTGDDTLWQGVQGDTVTVKLDDPSAQLASIAGGVESAANSSAASFATLRDTGAFGADDSLRGHVVTVTAGVAGDTQTRRVLGNTADTLFLDRDWDPVPGASFSYLVVDEADGAFALDTQGADDRVDASGSSLPLFIFGGLGNDDIRGGRGNDVIFGDRGRVDFLGEDGSVVTRLGFVRDDTLGDGQPNTGFVELAGSDFLRASAGDFPVADGGLTGLVINIINGSGAPQTRTIVGNTQDTISVDRPWDEGEVPDATSEYRISFVPEDQTNGVALDASLIITRDFGLGGVDTIRGNVGDDILIGGADGDLIDGNQGSDLIFGDQVKLERRPDGIITNPRFQALLGQMIYSRFDLPAELQGLIAPGEPNSDFPISGDAAGAVLVDGVARDYRGDSRPAWLEWEIAGLYHSDAIERGEEMVGSFGGDFIAGGAGHDAIFGQLGDDTIQGDGSIDLPAVTGTVVGASNPDPVDEMVTTITLDASAFAEGALVGQLIRVHGAAGSEVRRIVDNQGNLLTVAAPWNTLPQQGASYELFVKPGRAPDLLIDLTPTLNVMAPGELAAPFFTPSFDAASDGDDYIEGNGGDDVIFGNLGQDDLIGGSSNLFTLSDTSDREKDRALRPDGADLIFGGSGTRIEHEATVGEGVADPLARDSDAIAGDNANIYRLVGTDGVDGGGFLGFNYDEGRGGERITARGIELLDYTPGGPDFLPNRFDAAHADYLPDIGGGDEVHGESGDDFIYGMVGDDVLFGDSQNDDLIGGWGHDWISGGTGIDGVIGDDGRIYTGRYEAHDGVPDPTEASHYNELLNGVLKVDATNKVIRTPGDIQRAIINPDGKLFKQVDLTPFNLTPNAVGFDDPLFEPAHANDIIFGGLGNDFLHGSAGDDAISGTEALEPFFSRPVNPGDVLRFDPSRIEFGDYDEDFPRVEMPTFLLNFDATLPAEGDEDAIFGDLGNDWLVGGPDNDHLYGGWGADLLDADDDKSRNGGLNDAADGPDVDMQDLAFGGAGRDVLYANTGGDRLIDWAGEFNSFITPFAPFGLFTVSRGVPPQLFDFLYDLSAADGADPTRAIDTGKDAARNGEPEGELGLVIQRDAAWQAQTGAPIDPQPGNIPGGPRFTLRGVDFNSGTAEGFAADSGTWNVTSGRFEVAPETLGAVAAGVLHVGEYLPGYFEVVATINAGKPIAGLKSNAYLIFDYQSPTDFKFAGVNISTDKIQIGHADEDGWHVDAQTNALLMPNTDYRVLLAVNGLTATIVVDGESVRGTPIGDFSYAFAPRIDEWGFSHGLNEGMVGLGADNSLARIDDVTVQILYPEITFAHDDDFEDGLAELFATFGSSLWEVDAGRFEGTPAADSGVALSGFELEIGPNAILGLDATLTAEGIGGFFFDYYAADDYKFAGVNPSTDEVVIGHVRSGTWVIDASAVLPFATGSEVDFDVSLRGTTVSIAVDGHAILGHVFNAVTVDGEFGLLSAGGTVSVEAVHVETDDFAYFEIAGGENLVAAGMASELMGVVLTADDLGVIIDEAIRRWDEALGLDADALAALEAVDFRITDLSGTTLGTVTDSTIWLDVTAAGFGWYIDESPADDAEFGAVLADGSLRDVEGGEATGAMDLLSVVTHELGHALGLDVHEVLGESLESGTRVVPAGEVVPESPEHDATFRYAIAVLAMERSQDEDDEDVPAVFSVEEIALDRAAVL